MGKKSKIVDLVLSEDGSYEAKRAKYDVPKAHRGGIVRASMGEKPKFVRENHADEFLSGIDTGLDFIDKLLPRVERFLRLRG